MDRKAFSKNECNWKRFSVVQSIVVRKATVHEFYVAEKCTVRIYVNYNSHQIVGNKINPLNAKLNPIYLFLAFVGTHHIFHVSRVRVKEGVMRGACSTKRKEKCINNLVKNPTGKENVNIKEGVILAWILQIGRDIIDCLLLTHVGKKVSVSNTIFNKKLHIMREFFVDLVRSDQLITLIKTPFPETGCIYVCVTV